MIKIYICRIVSYLSLFFIFLKYSSHSLEEDWLFILLVALFMVSIYFLGWYEKEKENK